MKTLLIAGLAFAAFASSAQAAPDAAALAFIPPDQIAWKGDPKLGVLTHVLWGDPTKAGPYAILVRWLPGHMSRPHTHPNDRHITVISGTWWVGTGKDYAPETTTPMPAGSVVTH